MSTPSPQDNLVPNPSFEQAGGELPAHWTAAFPRPDAAAPAVSDTRFARSGARSLRISGAGRAGAIGWVFAACPGVHPGGWYEFSAYLRVEGVSSLHASTWAEVAWLRDADDAMARVVLIHRLAREGEWLRLWGRLRAPDDVHLARVALGLREAPHGAVWWDDVSLCQIERPPARRARLATAYLPQEQRSPEGWARAMDEAGDRGADALCLGELAEVVPLASEDRPTIPGPATETLGRFAARHQMLIVASLPEWQGSVCYNTAVLIGRDGRLMGRYQKTHLPHAEATGGTTPGSVLPVFDTDIGRVGLQVCYDHFFPEVTRLLALRGAEIVFVPIMGDIRAGGRAYEAVARARAIDNSVFYVTSIRDTGRSLIVDPQGEILADTAGTPGVVLAEVDLDAPRYERWLSVAGEAEFANLWPKERRPGLYGDLAHAL